MKRFAALLLISFFAFSGSYASAYAQENATSRPTPDQIKEFFTQIESGSITKEKLQAFLQTDSGTSNQVVQTGSAITSESAARNIMGDDIIFPEEVAKARGLSYTEAQLKQLSDTMPTADVLRWGKDNGYALMPSPPKAMSVLDVGALKDDQIDWAKSDYDGQAFAHNDKTIFGWLMIKKTPVDGSKNKDWGEENMLLSKVERVPNIAEMSWFIETFYDVRGTRLFDRNYVRTSSLDSYGARVYVGGFDANGLYVDRYHELLLFGIIGLSSARKLH